MSGVFSDFSGKLKEMTATQTYVKPHVSTTKPNTIVLLISPQVRKNSSTKILKSIHHLGSKMAKNRGSGLDNNLSLLQEDLKSQVSKPRDTASPDTKNVWVML